MRRNNEERQLTKAEMEIMNALWSRSETAGPGTEDGRTEGNGKAEGMTTHEMKAKGMTTHEIIEQYPEPHPAYSTIATFLKILVNKGFVGSRKQEGGGKTLVFFPLLSREEYTNRVMKEVKSTFFAGSLKSMLSFFAQQEEVSEEDLAEIVELINNKQK